jgi:hypothetical protein
MQEIALSYLGERDYIQGTTLFEALEPYCRGGDRVSLKISSLIRTDRVGVGMILPDAPAPIDCAATLNWWSREDKLALAVMPWPASEAPMREPFDESEITDLARFDTGAVDLSAQSPYSFIRTCVALNKAMLQRHLTPTEPGRWLFVRLDLDQYCDSYRQLSIRFRHNMRFAAVASDIFVNSKPLGSLLFSWSHQ